MDRARSRLRSSFGPLLVLLLITDASAQVAPAPSVPSAAATTPAVAATDVPSFSLGSLGELLGGGAAAASAGTRGHTGSPVPAPYDSSPWRCLKTSSMEANGATPPPTQVVGVLLYQNFSLTEAAGPITVFAQLRPVYQVVLIAQLEGPVGSVQGAALVAQHNFTSAPPLDILIVPGGWGVLQKDAGQLGNNALLDYVKTSYNAQPVRPLQYLMSVGSGSALLARAGLLNGKQATTNKNAFIRIALGATSVDWVPRARWVVAGNIMTASGGMAGTDMCLGFVQAMWGPAVAACVARVSEYTGQYQNSLVDPFGIS